MTDARSPHYIHPSAARFTRPGRVVSVQPYGYLDGEDGDRVRPYRLIGWAAWHADWDGAEWTAPRLTSGSTEGDWWDAVRAYSNRRRQPWYVLPRLLDALGQLGAWTELDLGALRLDSRAPGSSDALGDRDDSGWTGMAMIGDKSAALVTRYAGARGSQRWIDSRNWGIDRRPLRDDPVGTALAHMRDAIGWVDAAIRLGAKRVCITAAAQAGHLYREVYCDTPVLVHACAPALQLERESVYPGRCEAYRIGQVSGRWAHLDYSSAYPRICLGAALPARLAGHALDRVPDIGQLADAGYLVIARVRLRAQSPRYPLRRNGRTIYPVGRFTTVLCWPELRPAWEGGQVYSVLEAAWYEPSVCLDTYMSALLAERAAAAERGDKVGADAAKLLANSLVGKLAQHSHRWEHCPASPPPEPWSIWWHQCDRDQPCRKHRAIGLYSQHEVRGGEHPESCPAIASWVYSLQRERMAALIGRVGREEIAYLDTDGVWISELAYSHLVQTEWGQSQMAHGLRLTRWSDGLRIIGPKQYYTDTGRVTSGIPDGATEDGAGAWHWASARTMEETIGSGHAPVAEYAARRMPAPAERAAGHARLDGVVDPPEVWE